MVSANSAPLPDAVACENMAPEPNQRFARKTPLGLGAKKDGCFRMLPTQGFRMF